VSTVSPSHLSVLRYVEGADLFLCTTYTFSQFRDCQDLHYFMSADCINDVVCLPAQKHIDVEPVLACQDRVLRVLLESELLYEVEVPGPPTTLALYGAEGGKF
jgi:Bardet-Biedl syndrome 7 protein